MRLTVPENCFEIIDGGKLGLLINCDHASNILPQGYGRPGLAAAQFERRIAHPEIVSIHSFTTSRKGKAGAGLCVH